MIITELAKKIICKPKLRTYSNGSLAKLLGVSIEDVVTANALINGLKSRDDREKALLVYREAVPIGGVDNLADFFDVKPNTIHSTITSARLPKLTDSDLLLLRDYIDTSNATEASKRLGKSRQEGYSTHGPLKPSGTEHMGAM